MHKLCCCFEKVLCILNVENDSDGEAINRTSSNLRNVEYIDMNINPIGLVGWLYTICKDYSITLLPGDCELNFMRAS